MHKQLVSMLASLVFGSCAIHPACAQTTTTVELTWDNIPGADYCLHVQLKPGRGVELEGTYTEYVQNVANAGVLGSTPRYVFDGSCPSLDALDRLDFSDIAAFEINSAREGRWDRPELRRATRALYAGEDAVHLPFEVTLTWPRLRDAHYSLGVILRPGCGLEFHGHYTELIENVANAAFLKQNTSFVFDGTLPSREDIDRIALADVERFILDAATDGAWHARNRRTAAVRPFVGQSEIQLRFPIILRWTEIPGARYTVRPQLQDGTTGDAIAETDEPYHVFEAGADPDPASIAAFVVEARTSEGDHDKTESLTLSWDGRALDLFADFPSSPVHGMRSRFIKPNLADPDIVRTSEGYVLTGTDETNSQRIPFWFARGHETSPARADWEFTGHYAPNDPAGPSDPDWKYFHLWGPELCEWKGERYLIFSSLRERRTRENPDPPQPHADDRVTCYWARADAQGRFGAPEPFDLGLSGVPKHTADLEPPHTSGDPMKIKLDAMFLTETNPARVFYTWFREGNHVASFEAERESPDIIRHADPTKPEYQNICEAPDAMKRGEFYYVFYSTGWFNGHYRIRYRMARRVEDLVPGKAQEHDLTIPIMRPAAVDLPSPYRGSPPMQRVGWYDDTRMLRNAGHSAVVQNGEECWIFYHVGVFRDGIWWHGRDTWASPLRFRDDGTIYRISY